MFGNQRNAVRYLAAAQGRMIDVKVYFNGGEGLYIADDCSGSMARMEVRDNAEGNIINHASARRFVSA